MGAARQHQGLGVIPDVAAEEHRHAGRRHGRGHVLGAELGVPADRRRQLSRHHRQRRRRRRRARPLVPTPTRPTKPRQWFLSNSAGSGPYALESYTQGESLVLKPQRQLLGPEQAGVPAGHDLSRSRTSSSQLQQLQQGDVDIAMQISLRLRRPARGTPTCRPSRSTRTTTCTSPQPGRRRRREVEGPERAQGDPWPSTTRARSHAWWRAMARSRRRRSPTGSSAAPTSRCPSMTSTTPRQRSSDAGLGDGFTLDATYPDANVYGVDFSLMMQKIQQDLDKVGVDARSHAGAVPGVGRPDRLPRDPGDGRVLRARPHRLEPVRAVLRHDPRLVVGAGPAAATRANRSSTRTERC